MERVSRDAKMIVDKDPSEEEDLIKNRQEDTMIRARIERRLDSTTETALREKIGLIVNITEMIGKEGQLDIILRKSVLRGILVVDQASEEEVAIVVLITDKDLQDRKSADHSMRARVLENSMRDKTHFRMNLLTLMVILSSAFMSYITPKEEVPNAVLLVVVFALM